MRKRWAGELGKRSYPSAGSAGACSELGASRRGRLVSGPACAIPRLHVGSRQPHFLAFIFKDALQPMCGAGGDPRAGRCRSGRLSPPLPLTIPRGKDGDAEF